MDNNKKARNFSLNYAQKKERISCTPARFLLPLKLLIIKAIYTFQCAKVTQFFQIHKPK